MGLVSSLLLYKLSKSGLPPYYNKLTCLTYEDISQVFGELVEVEKLFASCGYVGNKNIHDGWSH